MSINEKLFVALLVAMLVVSVALAIGC